MYYPKAKEWMWNYCIYLGEYTSPDENQKYDLGVFIDRTTKKLSAAIVFGSRPGDYKSGRLDYYIDKNARPEYQETIKRAKEKGLMD